MNFADNLKKIRKDNGLSQEQLAEKLGISRQAVSKWESGQSYPEMDKVVQICSMFNVNMDELINEDIREVNERKETKNVTNKYVQSFFDYITKVVDMFTAMNFKQKISCLFEQCLVAIAILVILLIIGSIGSEIVCNLFRFLPVQIYYFIFYVLESLFLIGSIIVGAAIFLHIFKIRYLDYYEIVREKDEKSEKVAESSSENVDKSEDINKIDKNKIYLEKKQEKVIIRDPKDSGFSFINGLGKIMLLICKFIALLLLVFNASFLVGLVICFALSFAVIKSGLFFIGIISLFFGAILFSIVTLELLYNFIVSRKIVKGRVFFVAVMALIIGSLGLGIAILSFKDFDFVEAEYELVQDKYNLDMNENLVINYYGYDKAIEYIEKDIDNIEIILEHSNDMNVKLDEVEDDLYTRIYVHYYSYNKETFNLIKKCIEEFNNKRVLSFNSVEKIYVYASKDNIEKIKSNNRNYNNRFNELNKEINNLVIELDKVNQKNDELINYLESKNFKIEYDSSGNIISIYTAENNYNEE